MFLHQVKSLGMLWTNILNIGPFLFGQERGNMIEGQNTKNSHGVLGGIIVCVIGIILIFYIISMFSSKDESSSNTYENKYDVSTTEGSIESSIVDYIYGHSDLFDDTEIVNLTINAGTDASDDYVVLLYPKWSRQNSKQTTSEMMRLYCDDLASFASSLPTDIHELTVFWTIPYYNEDNVSAKCSYERIGDKLTLDKSSTSGLVELNQ